jgi:very-short-patch-repair endonuclease
MADFVRLADRKSNSRYIKRAKTLRKEAPMPERLLWEALRVAAKNQGLRFRRQHPFSPYTLDFVCLKARLVVEVDGASHDTRLHKDKERDRFLNALGYDVMRFTNEDARKNVEGVVSMILFRALERTG